MARYDGLLCPACGETFTADDDIVVCPICGTPHHRACWQARGACIHAEKHAQGFQWERPHTVLQPDAEANAQAGPICPRCGHACPDDSKFCPSCGLPFGGIHPADGAPADVAPPPSLPTQGGITLLDGTYFVPFGPGVSAEDTVDGNPMREVAEVVQVRTESYLPKFLRLERLHKKITWNWAAFFFPQIWFYYRKLYQAGSVVLALFLALSLLFAKPVTEFVSLYSDVLWTTVDEMQQEEPDEAAALAARQALRTSPAVKYVAVYYGLLLAVSVTSGLFANVLYKRDVKRRIDLSRRQAEDDDSFHYLLLRRGGITLFGAVLALFLPELAGLLIGLFM